MAELGAGTGSSYPAALDTDASTEVNGPAVGKTKARAEVPNDLAAAVVAIETELGTDPAGTLADVKTFLQTEHNTDGTHSFDYLRWKQVIAFTATPASTSTLTMTSDLTASILAGMSLKYKIGGTYYYGRVSAITSNLLTVNGASLGGDVTELWYGGGTITQMVIGIPGYYEDATNTTLILTDLAIKFIWKKPKSYCVYYSVYSVTHDSGTHGKATVYINSADVNSSAGGLTIAADATEYATVIDINTSNYDINPGESLEIASTKGGNGDAKDLTVIIVFITP